MALCRPYEFLVPHHAPANGGGQEVTIRARIQGNPGVFDDAKVLLLNYAWPGL